MVDPLNSIRIRAQGYNHSVIYKCPPTLKFLCNRPTHALHPKLPRRHSDIIFVIFEKLLIVVHEAVAQMFSVKKVFTNFGIFSGKH